MAPRGVLPLIHFMRTMFDILRALTLALLVFHSAAPVAAAGAGGLATVSCLGAVAPAGDDLPGGHAVHAACWSCCTTPNVFAPPAVPTRAAPTLTIRQRIEAGIPAPRTATRQSPPARAPPALI
ncbi:MAG: hypothetical protein ACI9ZH_001936 [Paracoccaceae bacterium]|jgi:hypothetical protein